MAAPRVRQRRCKSCKLMPLDVERGERLALLYPWDVTRHSICGHVLTYRSGGASDNEIIYLTGKQHYRILTL